ncbi:MAG: hypothetical protein ABSD29_06080, partial [Verrucomicrobiota bacterium]
NELTLLTVTNTAFETNIHATLGYALVNPPGGAAIDGNGIITWTPSQSQGSSTNTITTEVTNTDLYDLVNPHLSATNSFTVIVNGTIAPPVIQSIAVSNGVVTITWSAVTGQNYKLQYKSSLDDTDWNDFPSSSIATWSQASATDTMSGGAQRFYRVVLQP